MRHKTVRHYPRPERFYINTAYPAAGCGNSRDMSGLVKQHSRKQQQKRQQSLDICDYRKGYRKKNIHPQPNARKN